MYRIIRKKMLNPSVCMMDIEAPAVARKAQAGQFIILRVDEKGERIPLTIAGCDRDMGTVKIIFQTVGATTMLLCAKNEGEEICDFVGPLGNPTDTKGLHKVVVVGGGVGCAIALPLAQKLHDEGCEVTSVCGFRNAGLAILADEFKACSTNYILMTDDGSAGSKGLVTEALEELLSKGGYDCVFAIGPLVMMKYTVRTAEKYSVRSVVSMNPIMIDGTGMCGGCRLTVGGKMRFACVDGPDFEGSEVDFDEAIARSSQYREEEARARDAACNLLKKEGC